MRTHVTSCFDGGFTCKSMKGARPIIEPKADLLGRREASDERGMAGTEPLVDGWGRTCKDPRQTEAICFQIVLIR